MKMAKLKFSDYSERDVSLDEILSIEAGGYDFLDMEVNMKNGTKLAVDIIEFFDSKEAADKPADNK